MAWWILWYSICLLLLAGHSIDFIININALGDKAGIVMKYILLIILAYITLQKFPSVSKLVSKDLKKNSNNLQAKAMKLERELHNLKKHEKEKQEADGLDKKVTEMEAEIQKIKSED